ncbi:MAG: bifunctional phosphopantothenoylcysteine decarboxylase/phosphopantothenate--cysteine ligase CoaBC [Vampirovibrio sp.]
MFFHGNRIVLGVCASVAAYKSADLIRTLQRLGAEAVHPILSQEAPQFITALTLSSLSKKKATAEHHAVDEAGVPLHISLAQWGDALLIYPATANSLAQLAQGLTGDLLTATALCFDAKPIVIAPAMNRRMWEHPLTQRNLDLLSALPHVFMVPPVEGLLACGETGSGHLAPDAWTLLTLYKALHPQAHRLVGKKILVTAGGTQEALDPARVLTNRSSGKMGRALADEAYAMGADVTLISATPLDAFESRPYQVQYCPSVDLMRTAVLKAFAQQDWLLKAAAVSDFRPRSPQAGKIKKSEACAHYTLDLEITPDILKEACAMKQPHQKVLGFAAESETGDYTPLYEKLRRKGADALAVNAIGREDIAFHQPDNEMTLLWTDETQAPHFLAKAPKDEIARGLLMHLCDAWL